MINTRKRGSAAEHRVCQYLKKQRLKLIEKNFYCRHGEIDLIMLDNDVLAFIEVRHRNHQDFMQTIETIDQRKQRKIIMTSQFYLLGHPAMNDYDLRFDVVTIDNINNDKQINWLKNAFQA